MAVETRCQNCGVILAIDDQHAGLLARCPQCQFEYTIPERSDLEALDAVCHYCGTVLPPGEQADLEFKACIDCQDSIEENQAELAAEAEASAEFRGWMAWSFTMLGVGFLLIVALAVVWSLVRGSM